MLGSKSVKQTEAITGHVTKETLKIITILILIAPFGLFNVKEAVL